MVNALNNMPKSDNTVSGNNGIGVLMGNSLMFQRFPTHDGYDDPRFSNFYGQTFPLLKRGVPVQTVHMENLGYKESLQDIRVLIMSYSNMKPFSQEVHKNLENWVKNGGTLIYTGRDDDPYQNVMEWWNQKRNDYDKPSGNLFEKLGLNRNPSSGKYQSGKGYIHVLRQNPKEFVMENGGDEKFIKIVKQAFEDIGSDLKFKNNLSLQRGPYKIIAVMDESVSNDFYITEGPVVDLFDPLLPVLSGKTVVPGEEAFLYDLQYAYNHNQPKVVAAAARISNGVWQEKSYSFTCKSPVNTMNSMRVFLPAEPKEVILKNKNNEVIKTERV